MRTAVKMPSSLSYCSNTANDTMATKTVSEDDGYHVVNEASQWKKQLVTKEDPSHVHKTLGILVLLSFFFRWSQFGASDLGFAKYPHLTVPTIALHFLLNASSFIFKIPKKRISSGYRIWPEYRLHSLVFAGRSLALATLFYVETTFHLPQNNAWNLVIVLATMAFADLFSWSRGQYRSSSVRDLSAPAAVKYFFSFAQFGATTMVLFGQRRYTMPWAMLTIVQVNAFLMTLRRKNLASQTLLVTIYGSMLAFGFVVVFMEYGRLENGLQIIGAMSIICNIVTCLRTGPRIPLVRYVLQDNKFGLWTAMYFLLDRVLRRPEIINAPLTPFTVALYCGSYLPSIALGVYKHNQEKRDQSSASKSQ